MSIILTFRSHIKMLTNKELTTSTNKVQSIITIKMYQLLPNKLYKCVANAKLAKFVCLA